MRQRRPPALLVRPRPAQGCPRAFDRSLAFGARPFVEQRRRFGADARHHLSALHGVARLELDAKHPPRHGRRHDEPLAHPGRPLLVDRHHERTPRDGANLHGHRFRPQRDGKEPADNG
jgi:hypothetical protein